MPEPSPANRDNIQPTWLVALDTGGTFTDLAARAPNGELVRAKVPSDGSISATVTECAGTRVRIAPAAGLRLPDGLLDGWMLAPAESSGAASVAVAQQRGNAIETAAPIAIAVGTPVRFVQRERTIDAPRLGLHVLTGTPLGHALPPIELRLSTTRGTNALLEGRGAKVGVIVSEALEGVVDIGDQTRDELFARVPRPRTRIAHATRAVHERTLADGTRRATASADEVARATRDLAAAGCDAIVVSLAHGLANAREREIAGTIAGAGATAIAATDIAPHPRLLTRTETACIHARIAPILQSFVDDATRGGMRAFVFTSAGVLQSARSFLARDTLFSGPAGGARAVAAIASRHGLDRAVGFDMGGTSSDVTRTAHGALALRAESRIGRATVAAPSVAIDSVAAGGGSICRVRDGAFEVGPESAGSNPGPACYGRGGPLTISDVNLLAGRFAAGFECEGRESEGLESAGFTSMGLDRAAAERALEQVCRERGCSASEAIEAFLDIANARMALAIEALCVRDGVDPRGHALVAFGGAGGQHACSIAERLGLERIVFPRYAGFLCAQGVFDAAAARFAIVPALVPLVGSDDALRSIRERAEREARAALAADGFTSDAQCETIVSLRLSGQEAAIEVAFGSERELDMRFRARFLELFGYAPPARAVEVVSIRSEAVAANAHATPAPAPSTASTRAPNTEPAPSATVQILIGGAHATAALRTRASLQQGEKLDGPTLIVDVGETVVLDRGWQASVHASGDLVATRTAPAARRESSAEQELFSARLESIALAMGHVLERTALSPNIRDRLDFSCAVLDADGTLVQNAPHLPVHLGALGVCVRGVAATLDLREGDIAVTNHPAFGGSHLPDVTTVAPVFADGTRVGYVAVRAHHAEIGGTRPGSFPPDARSLAEEGVVLEPFLAVRAGELDFDATRARFAGGPHPSRNPDENIADLLSQIAATRHGVDKVRELARELGPAFAQRCDGELDRAERALRARIAAWSTDHASATRALDDGAEIRVQLTRSASDRLRIDFTGSSPLHPRNFNAPRAVTQAAVMYALRLFVDQPIPMNEGLLRAIDLLVPEGMLNPRFESDPARCPPVVAGNVETSQSVVAVLADALALSAESQSTMNNTLIGNARFSVYETLGGGAGAGPDGDGASAVHVHMSNTRLTDIDVLERRAPIVIREFRVRDGSGGDGAHRGGDGLVRSYEFREPVSLSFFGSRRNHAPQGCAGGDDGACGTQSAVVGGARLSCGDAVLSMELGAGDVFTVSTPGGGGYGDPAARSSATASAAARVRAD